MDGHADRQVDARAWLLWGGACMLPLLTGRHPLALIELLMIVSIVRVVCVPFPRASGWAWLVRLAALAIPIGVVFNLMTVHAGEQVILDLPSNIPLIGGVLTWNAATYGLLSGLTIVTLVAVGTTVAALIEWSAMMRILPARAGTLAVAGSVAWSFLPQLARSWQEIRETQAARGHQWRGARDFVPLMVPLLAGGLDRSIATAESLESRGFGVLTKERSMGRGGSIAVVMMLATAITGLYLFATGSGLLAMGLVLAAVALGAGAFRSGTHRVPTHYRRTRWRLHDTIIVAAATLAIIATVIALRFDPAALQYDPYPDLSIPAMNPLLLLALAALLAPAFSMTGTPTTSRQPS